MAAKVSIKLWVNVAEGTKNRDLKVLSVFLVYGQTADKNMYLC
jgi:hypothetical protein